jgi:hypothetical protein
MNQPTLWAVSGNIPFLTQRSTILTHSHAIRKIRNREPVRRSVCPPCLIVPKSRSGKVRQHLSGLSAIRKLGEDSASPGHHATESLLQFLCLDFGSTWARSVAKHYPPPSPDTRTLPKPPS